MGHRSEYILDLELDKGLHGPERHICAMVNEWTYRTVKIGGRWTVTAMTFERCNLGRRHLLKRTLGNDFPSEASAAQARRDHEFEVGLR